MDLHSMRTWVEFQDGTSKEENINIIEVEQEGVKAFFIEATIPQLKSQDDCSLSFHRDCAVGIQFINFCTIENYMADYLYGEFWCKPFFGTDLRKVPKDTQALLFRRKDGNYGFLLPVCSEKYKCTLEGNDEGLYAKMYSWYEGLKECKGLGFLYAEGQNPFELIQNCVRVGMKIMDHGCRIRKERIYPEIFEYLGWCTWDALQIRVNARDVLKKCEEFHQKEIPVRWLIVDDMWANVKGLNDIKETVLFNEMVKAMHEGKLFSFQADKTRFPNGLEACINSIKEKYGLKVGMWHPTTGYWKGIDPEGDIAKEYGELLDETEDGRLYPSTESVKANIFFDAFHTYLKDCGVDFVKIDNQSFFRKFARGKAPVGEMARNVHNAIENSTGVHFNNQLINCMGMAQENMWNRPSSAISRCSADFLPENREWFTDHILQCSYNSLIQGEFIWCDWDMWWTDDSQAIKNSILRVISGGPIYISDKIGRSRKEILMPMVLSDGRILRCDYPAVPMKDCLLNNPVESSKPFLLWNRCGSTAIIAAYHLNKRNEKLEGRFSVSEIPGLDGGTFAVYEHFSKTVKFVKSQEIIEFSLENQDDLKLFIIVPMIDDIAHIGMINKYISPKTIIKAKGLEVEVLEGGIYAIASKKDITAVRINGRNYEVKRENDLLYADCRY